MLDLVFLQYSPYNELLEKKRCTRKYDGKKERCGLKWAEVSIQTTHEATDVVAEIYHDIGAQGVVIEDPELLNSYIDSGMWDFSDIERAEQTDIVTIKAYLPADEDLDERLRSFELRIREFQEREGDDMEKGSCRITWKPVQDEDWADNWKQYFHPEKVGGMIVIKPTWEDYTASPDDIVVELDPGSAFGTGTHPTTAMCIRELEKLVRGGMRVFDVGTGSGVLAITAAKLGAGEVVAMDYDKTSVGIAAENIAQNGVASLVKTGVSDKLHSFEGKADLIVANIIADIVIDLLAEVDEHLARGGHLLASGIISERLADVTEACQMHHLTVDKVTEEKGWVAMTISRGEAE